MQGPAGHDKKHSGLVDRVANKDELGVYNVCGGLQGGMGSGKCVLEWVAGRVHVVGCVGRDDYGRMAKGWEGNYHAEFRL